jgi:hypothetical protein
MQTYCLFQRQGEKEQQWIVTHKGELIGSFPTRWQAVGVAIEAARVAGNAGDRAEVVMQDDDKCMPHPVWVYGNEACPL